MASDAPGDPLLFPCPTCGVPSQAGCLDPKGRPRGLHKDRKDVTVAHLRTSGP